MGRFPSGQREQTVNLPLLASVVRIHPCPPYLREWRNWQTRMIQVHVYVRTCRFKSCFPHRPEVVVNQQLPDFLYPLKTPKSLTDGKPIIIDRILFRHRFFKSNIWKYQMKGQKKFHIGISSSGSNMIHKFSDIALQFLAEVLNDHKDDPNWANTVKAEYAHRYDGKNEQ